MKKLLVLLSAFLLIFAVSCDNSTTSPSVPDTPDVSDVPVVTPPSEEDTQPVPQEVLDSLNAIINAVAGAEPVGMPEEISRTEMVDDAGETVYAIVDDTLIIYRDITAPAEIPDSYPEGYFDGVVLKPGTYKLDSSGSIEGIDLETNDKLIEITELLDEIEGWILTTVNIITENYADVTVGSDSYVVTVKSTESLSDDVYAYEYTLNAPYNGIDHFIRYEKQSVFSTEVAYTIIGGEYDGNYSDETAVEAPVIIEIGDPVAEEIMTPFMTFFTGAAKGIVTGEVVAGTQTSFTVIAENGYAISDITFEKGSTLCYTDTELTADLVYDGHSLVVEATVETNQAGMAVTSCFASYDGTVYDATIVANAALAEMFPAMSY